MAGVNKAINSPHRNIRQLPQMINNAEMAPAPPELLLSDRTPPASTGTKPMNMGSAQMKSATSAFNPNMKNLPQSCHSGSGCSCPSRTLSSATRE